MLMIHGLSDTEAATRRAAGQGNNIDLTPNRSYWHILRDNLFTFVNMVLITIGVLLVLLGSPADAITTAGLVILNILVGVVQEARAKRKLDQIALLTRPKVTVIREGAERELDPSAIVLGDAVVVKMGDQIVTDGRLLTNSPLEVDESLLTGESDTIPKAQGDVLHSGSFCTSGAGVYETTQVGAESLANKITAKARDFKVTRTPLQKDVNLIVRLVGLLSAVLGGLLMIEAARANLSAVERVQMMAVVMGMIPQGLIFLVTLTYALGAVRIAGKGALVQRSNAVESMSNISVLCLDKTGTLTTNQIKVHALYAWQLGEEALGQKLGVFAASAGASNKTNDALRAAYGASGQAATDEVPFTSARKWSGMRLDGVGYVLGAPEVLNLPLPESASTQRDEWAGAGLRVLLFAQTNQTLQDAADKPRLPDDLRPLGLVALSDVLRPNAREILENFKAAGIKLKIISGDNPQTVAALAAQAGFDLSGGVVSGLDLAKMDAATFGATARRAAVFGRINPDQKEALVVALQSAGEYVAMIGDGVNDVPSLKKADIGIAMNSGSTAARNVAEIVLLDDSFAVLPAVFSEGQRIVNGIMDTMRLLLSRTSYVALLIVATSVVDVDFPFLPTHDAVNSFATAGLPPILLAIWARSGQPPAARLREVLRFIFPVSLSVGLAGLGVFLYFLEHSPSTAQSALSTFVIFCGVQLILFVKPPTPFFVASDPLSGDWRSVGAVLGVLAGYGLLLVVEPLRDFFEFTLLGITDYVLIAGLALLWGLLARALLRTNAAARFLGWDNLGEKSTM